MRVLHNRETSNYIAKFLATPIKFEEKGVER